MKLDMAIRVASKLDMFKIEKFSGNAIVCTIKIHPARQNMNIHV